MFIYVIFHYKKQGQQMNSDILDEQVLYQNGSFRRIRRWLMGWYPERGILIIGYTGKETIEEISKVIPIGLFVVV
jgi:hypothetical protein